MSEAFGYETTVDPADFRTSEIDAAFDALEDGTDLTARQVQILHEYKQEVHFSEGEE